MAGCFPGFGVGGSRLAGGAASASVVRAALNVAHELLLLLTGRDFALLHVVIVGHCGGVLLADAMPVEVLGLSRN